MRRAGLMPDRALLSKKCASVFSSLRLRQSNAMDEKHHVRWRYPELIMAAVEVVLRRCEHLCIGQNV